MTARFADRARRRASASMLFGMRSVYLRPELLTEGYTDKELRRLRRRGELSVVRPGAYVPGAPPGEPEARHLLLLEAELEHLAENSVVSHVSAAVLHRLPIWGLPLGRVHVTRHRGRSGSRPGGRVHVHTARLAASDVVRIGGAPVTSIGRTLADIARSAGFETAVAMTDGALHKHRVSPAELQEVLASMRRWPGVPAARRVFAFADPGSQSVGESRSRIAIARAGLPAPILQWNAVGGDQVDFYWPQLRTVGEFDGKVKYGRLLLPGEDPAAAVYREKVREDRIRATDKHMVRWAWDEIDDFGPVAARIRAGARPI
ncbi:hypothetical protein [Pseudonocardia sp. GCM10023141]|uniref:hypothetical protein n=1 Tax=Pseudonocardia sp. GCM10023141 TaxID=3252653 RepID=UPI0036200A41